MWNIFFLLYCNFFEWGIMGHTVNFNVTLFIKDEIFRLQITMADTILMTITNSTDHLSEEFDSHLLINSSSPHDIVESAL